MTGSVCNACPALAQARAGRAASVADVATVLATQGAAILALLLTIAAAIVTSLGAELLAAFKMFVEHPVGMMI